MRLELAGKRKKTISVPGFRFSPRNPIHKARPTNGASLIFIPKNPLKSRQRYWATLSATVAGKPTTYQWTFATAK